MSTSTPAEPLDPLGGGVAEHVLAAADEFCGSGAAAAKSAALSSVSVQPPPARTIAFVALPAGAAVAEEILEVGRRRAATSRGAARQGRRVVDERDLSAGGREVGRAGCVG